MHRKQLIAAMAQVLDVMDRMLSTRLHVCYRAAHHALAVLMDFVGHSKSCVNFSCKSGFTMHTHTSVESSRVPSSYLSSVRIKTTIRLSNTTEDVLMFGIDCRHVQFSGADHMEETYVPIDHAPRRLRLAHRCTSWIICLVCVSKIALCTQVRAAYTCTSSHIFPEKGLAMLEEDIVTTSEQSPSPSQRCFRDNKSRSCARCCPRPCSASRCYQPGWHQ
jgi:hypothetical protein